MSLLRLLIIDHVYEDPDDIRRKALQMPFSEVAPHLPAKRSTKVVLPSEIKSVFKSSLGIDIEQASSRIAVNGAFQLMLKRDFAHSYIHADSSAQWAGIVYLSSPPLEAISEGGTFFYRHRLTGLTESPSPESIGSVASSLGLKPTELKTLLKADAKNPQKWIITDRVAFQYNRFVLYDAKLFHRNGMTWGASPKSGRLTHNFFV